MESFRHNSPRATYRDREKSLLNSSKNSRKLSSSKENRCEVNEYFGNYTRKYASKNNKKSKLRSSRGSKKSNRDSIFGSGVKV